MLNKPAYEELEIELRKAQLYVSAIGLLSKGVLKEVNIDEAIRLLNELKKLL